MDIEIYFRFVLALGLVLGLIAAAAWAMKRWGSGMTRVAGRERRLAVVEVLPLDAKRRLILVRRDGVEHLLLAGGGTDLVVETAVPASPRATPRDET